MFVVPSTELWTGTRVEVGCYTDQDKQVGWSQIQIRRGWLSFYDVIDISLIVMHVSFLMDTASTETMTRLSVQIIWARQPLGGGEEELVAHQDTLLLAQDPRISVFVQQLGDRQVSKVTVRLLIAGDFKFSIFQISEALPADSGKYSCISMGGAGASAEEERTEVMVAVFDEINNEVDLTQPQNMNSDTSDINRNETIVMEGTRGPRLDATTSLRSDAVRNLGGLFLHLTNLFLAILVHTNC